MRTLVVVIGMMIQVAINAPLFAQAEDAIIEPAQPARRVPADDRGFDRIFGVIPNFLAVEAPNARPAPLTAKQKLVLAAKSTFDPFAFFGSAAGAAMSQISQSDPKYGQGKGAYFQRYGAAFTDMATQNFISTGLLAPLFHEDPRYFRLGPEAHFLHRVGYALSRSVIARTDAGKERMSYSSLVGTMMGIGLSNAYYPAASRNGTEMLERLSTSFSSGALNNLLPEFWPDIKRKLHQWKH
jgi:hypothetical protein